MSSDFDVIIAPSRIYLRERAQPAPSSLRVALRRPALIALVLGVTSAIAATDHVDLRLVISTTLCWCFIPVIQLGLSALVIRSSARRSIAWPRAIDLFFMSHTPWSLWLLGYAAWEMLTPTWIRPANLPLWVVPLVALWTSAILFAFCRVVLDLTPRAAFVRVTAHQAATWTLFVLFFGWAVQLWPRLIGFAPRVIGFLQR